MVESEKLQKLINSSEALSWEDIAWLELKSKQYPYFQSIRVIIAKHYLQENHVLKSHKIHTASTYAIDRNILRRRLTEKNIPIASVIAEEVKTFEQKTEVIEAHKAIIEKEVEAVVPPIEVKEQETVTPEISTKEKSREELLKAVHDRLAELQKNKASIIEEKVDPAKKEIASKTDTIEAPKANVEIVESTIENIISTNEEIVAEVEKEADVIINEIEIPKELVSEDSNSTRTETPKEDTSETPIIDSKTVTEESTIIAPPSETELKAEKEAKDARRKQKLAETKRKKDEQKLKDEQIKSEIEAQSKPEKLFYSRLGNELNIENSDSIDLLLNYLESQKEKKKIVEEISYDEIKEVKIKAEKSTESIIEKFIQNDPRISKPDPKAKTPSEDLSESKYSKTKFVSENLAKIKAKQGYIKEAKEIYQELSLKNPEKRSYFTEQINKLK